MSNMSLNAIKEYLPHRFPFLLIDRVLDCNDEASSITALKNVTCNEGFFAGHFPEYPVMPGVLMTEAMAQAAAILVFRHLGKGGSKENLFFLAGIDRARFKRPVHPGDQMIIRVQVIQHKRSAWKFQGKITVNDQLVCSAEILLAAGDATDA